MKGIAACPLKPKRKRARIFVLVGFLAVILFTPTTIHARTITFGEIMSGYVPGESVAGASNVRDEQIAQLLDRLGITGQESRDAFEKRLAEYNKNKITSQPFDYAQDMPTTDLSDLIATPIPSPNPTTTYLLAQLDARSSVQLSASSVQFSPSNSQTQTTGNRQPNADHLGELDQNPIKTTYTIAILGDSMVDTLGPGFPALATNLKAAYPKISFAVLNFGQGSTDLQSGWYRLTNSTTYLGKYVPPVLSYKPDILVVESFGYNHWSINQYDLDRQWLTLAYMIDTIRSVSPDTKIIIASTIGPNPYTFGDGKLNWPKELKWESAQTTKIYLQNAINFADSQKLPIANAYHPSLDGNGHGRSVYINQGDHLHPSDAGKALFAEKIVEAIQINKLIE